MTVQDMHIGVNLGVQRMASNIDSNLLKEEVDYYLNESVDEYIKSQYLSYKQKTRSKESDFVLENLRTLISTINYPYIITGGDEVSNSSINFTVSTFLSNAFSFNLPNNFLYYVEAKTSIDGVSKNNILLSHTSIKKLLETKYNKPLYRELPTLIENTTAHVLLLLEDWAKVYNSTGSSPGFIENALKVNFTYLKKPAVITYGTPELNDGDNGYIAPTDCDLPTQTHKEIVNLTITKILNILNQGTKQ